MLLVFMQIYADVFLRVYKVCKHVLMYVNIGNHIYGLFYWFQAEAKMEAVKMLLTVTHTAAPIGLKKLFT